MFPFVEVFGIKLYMTGVGIVLAGIVFIITVYKLCKQYNQDFMTFFTWLPVLLISTYVLGLYSTFVLKEWSLIPTTLSIFSPYGYRFWLIGILAWCMGSLLLFLRRFRRNESKKVWIDIFFFGFVNGLVALGLFLLLGDSFVGNECNNWICVHSLMPESELVKYTNGVYPIGIFLSLGALSINTIISFWKMSSNKSGLGIRGFIGILLVLLAILPFWNYPAHGIINLWQIRFDIYHICIIGLIGLFLILQRRWRKPY